MKKTTKDDKIAIITNLSKEDPWMVAEVIPDIFFNFCHTWLFSFTNNLENSCGKNYTKVLAVFHGTNMTFYYGTKDSEDFEKHLVEKINATPRFGKLINTKILKHSTLLMNWAKKLEKKDLKKLSNHEISQLIKQQYDIHTKLYEWGWLSNATDMFHATFTNTLKQHLKSYLEGTNNNESACNEYLMILSTPRKLSIVTEQEIELLAIIEAIQKNHPCLKIASRENIAPKIKKAITEYTKKYHHLKYLWIGKQGTYNETDFYHKINDFLASEASALHHILLIRKEQKEKLEQKKKLKEKLKLGRTLEQIFEVYGEFMLTKAFRREAQIKWSYEYNILLEEIGKRLSIEKKYVYFMLPDELIQAIQTNKVNKAELIARENESVYYTEKRFEAIYTGKKAKELIASINLQKSTEQNEVKGQCGNLGKVQGKVCIVNTISDMHKVKEGNILVSITTNPDLLPAMKKAAAFVTEQGGITSHAAIVAREMKKPCVIGTKIATKVFKDGDMIEVDANNGMVKKIDVNKD